MTAIPKIIHYCWFGRGPLPDSAIKCLNSWKKFLPDYEIIRWDEDNFDVNSLPYTRQAYEARKFAFVSDYVRYKVLYEMGGLYFDTDVEVIRPLDDIISAGPFMGYEIDPKDGKPGEVAPGLGLGARPGMEFYSKILEFYAGINFLNPDNTLNQTTIVKYNTRLLIEYGLRPEPGNQTVAGITIYPATYFNPLDDATGRLRITADTHTIHWFTKSWMKISPMRQKLSRLAHRLFGVSFTSSLRRLLSRK